MPSCSDKTREAMRKLYNTEVPADTLDLDHYGWDSFATDYLEEHGIKLGTTPETRFNFQVPKDRELTDDECTCLDYMCDEWDYAWERV